MIGVSKSRLKTLALYGLTGLISFYALYLIGSVLANNAVHILQLSGWAKFAFFKLFLIRLCLYSFVYWQLPTLLSRYKKKPVQPETVLIVRKSLVKLCLVYEVVFGLSLIHWF